MTEQCETCRFCEGTGAENVAVTKRDWRFFWLRERMLGKRQRPISICARYPQWKLNKRDHWCGEHQPKDPEQ